jgi:archaemetzincin
MSVAAAAASSAAKAGGGKGKKSKTAKKGPPAGADSAGAGAAGTGVLTATASRALLVNRACKTAVHELGHMIGIGHCVHAFCCMNGSGHLREDFRIPHHLCPVCVAKVKHVFGDDMDLARRAQKMLAFFNGNAGFESEAGWLQRAVAAW